MCTYCIVKKSLNDKILFNSYYLRIKRTKLEHCSYQCHTIVNLLKIKTFPLKKHFQVN